MGRPRKADEVIVAALTHGKTHAEAARLSGVSERTIRRRLEDPQFAERVTRARAESTAIAAARLVDLFPSAIEALHETLEHGEGHVRIRAAQIVFKAGLELRDRTEFEDRLLALEARADVSPDAARTGHYRPGAGRPPFR